MSVDTGGERRGLVGRWLMRFEASSSVLSLVFQGTTAVSALSGVLAYVGYGDAVIPVLAAGLLGITVFSYAYVESGVFNRKNREKIDRGNNFASPRDKIDDSLIGCAVFAAIYGRRPTDEERTAIVDSVSEQWAEFRDGVDLPEPEVAD